jgi:hypothetical protein
MADNPLTFRYRDADLGEDAEAKRRLLRTLRQAAERCLDPHETMADIVSDLRAELRADYAVFDRGLA